MIDEKKLINEFYEKIDGGYDRGCIPEDCREAERLGESCVECVLRRTGHLINSQPQTVGIDKQKLIEELEKKYHDIAKEDDERWV